MRSLPLIPVCAVDYLSEHAVWSAEHSQIKQESCLECLQFFTQCWIHRHLSTQCLVEAKEAKGCQPILDWVHVSERSQWVETSHSPRTCLHTRLCSSFPSGWYVGERHRQRRRERGGIVSSRLTCLCSDPVLQCAAVQMMSSPPAAPNAMHVHCRGRTG